MTEMTTTRRNEILSALICTRMTAIEAQVTKLKGEPKPVLSGSWFDAAIPDIDAEIESEFAHWMELATILRTIDDRLGPQTRADFDRLTTF